MPAKHHRHPKSTFQIFAGIKAPMTAATIRNLRVEIRTPEKMIGMALQVVAIIQLAIQARSESTINWIS